MEPKLSEVDVTPEQDCPLESRPPPVPEQARSTVPHQPRHAPPPIAFAQQSPSRSAKHSSLDDGSNAFSESSNTTSTYTSGLTSEAYNESSLAGPGERPRISKMEKIRELREENKKLRAALQQLDSEGHSQDFSGEGTRQESLQDKQLEALRALTSLTKKQQECITAHEERYNEMFKEFEYERAESHRHKKELSKKRKEVSMLESQIDANLTEITSLRKELALNMDRCSSLENEHKIDRAMLMDLSTELARTRAGKSDASDNIKDIADKIQIFEDELREKNNEVEDQRNELMNQKELIQRLYVDLERTQDQVEKYERERDTIVADMETYYEALKHELEEKNRLLEAAEQERMEIKQETLETIDILESRCDQLSSQLMDADEELAVLRREQGPSSGAQFEEERERLNLNLETMSQELEEMKRRYASMGISHGEAYRELEEETAALKLELTKIRAALQEANRRSTALSASNDMLKVENRSLFEISRDLQLKLRNEQSNAKAVDDGRNLPRTTDSQLSRSASSLPRSVALHTVRQDTENNCSDSDTGKDTDRISTSFSDEANTQPLSSPTPPDGSGRTSQQALLLQAAAARKIQQSSAEKGTNASWRSKMMNLGGQSTPLSLLSPIPNGSNSPRLSPTSDGMRSSSMSDLEYSDKDTVIESLQRTNKQLEETIGNLKSELVRLNAFYKDAAYLSTKTIESLTQENTAYQTKLMVLEKMLKKLGGSIDLPNEDGDDAPSTLTMPKFHHRIIELEEAVSALEEEKNAAEMKMKAVESDLEHFQRTSKQASLDSLREIERLQKENAEQKRKLELFENEGNSANEGDTET